MMRLSYRLYCLATALQYRVPRRLTKAGLVAGTGMIMAGAVGSDIDQSMAFQAFALLFCVFLVGLVWLPLFRGRFTAGRQLPRLASVGLPFHYQVEVRNAGTRGYRDLELLENLADPRPGYAEFAEAMRPAERMRTFRLAANSGQGLDLRQAVIKPGTVSRLSPGGSARVEMEAIPLRRGVLRFTGLTVARRDPFGLTRSFVRLSLPHTVLVLPKRYPIGRFPFPGTRQYQPGGVALASSIGESEEFVSLREYRPGDPFRRIHWRSWARVGRPVVKEYQDEFFTRYGLVLDTFAKPARSDEFEAAVSVAASFACDLDTQESLLDLLFVGGQAFSFTAGRGLGRSERILEILASVCPNRTDRFGTLRDVVLQHAPVLSACICVLLGWDEPRRELVRRLRSVGLPVLTLLVGHDKAGVASGPATDLLPGEVRRVRPGRIAEDLQTLNGVEA